MLTKSLGSFGRVRLARKKDQPQEYVAVKMLKKAEILRLKQVDHIISENTILSNIQHPFLVSSPHTDQSFVKINMLGFQQDDRYLYIVLEYVQGGELFTYMRNVGKLEVNEA